MIIDLKDSVLVVIADDDEGYGHLISLNIGEGTLTWNEKSAIEYMLDRGLLASAGIREGDEQPCELSFNVSYDYITVEPLDTDLTVVDVIKGVSNGTTVVSVDSDACKPYACHLRIIYSPSGCDQEQITFYRFRWESLDYDPKAGTISCSGKIDATEPTITRSD